MKAFLSSIQCRQKTDSEPRADSQEFPSGRAVMISGITTFGTGDMMEKIDEALRLILLLLADVADGPPQGREPATCIRRLSRSGGSEGDARTSN